MTSANQITTFLIRSAGLLSDRSWDNMQGSRFAPADELVPANEGLPPNWVSIYMLQLLTPSMAY